MLAGVEARPVFTDYRVVEYFAKLSFDVRTDKSYNKKLLKDLFKDILPKEIIHRKKIGFPVNVDTLLDAKYGETSYDRWINYNLEFLIW